MMKKTIFAWALPLFLALLGLGVMLFPPEGLLEKEKRYPADSPSFSLQSGVMAAETEAWAADRLPLRDLWTGVNGLWVRLTGQGIDEEILVSKGTLTERPIVPDVQRIQKSLDALASVSASVGLECLLVAPPSAGYTRSGLPLPYPDDEIYSVCLSAPSLRTLDLRERFLQAPDPFYHTDPHWNAQGAYLAYTAVLEAWGMEALSQDAFTVTVADDFYGSCWTRAMLWLLPPERLEMWQAGALTVTLDGGEGHDGPFYPGHLHTMDAYSVFLDGNHGLTRIHNPSSKASGRLLVVKDSFGNALAPLLAAHFTETVLIDPRAFRDSILDLGRFDRFAAVFSLSSLNSFTSLAHLH